MEIKLNTNIDSIGRIATGQPIKTEIKIQGGGAAFEKSEALNQTLRQLPDSRMEKVAVAKENTALSTYPPPETIKKISALLAMNIGT
jgi:hypothetical protein